MLRCLVLESGLAIGLFEDNSMLFLLPCGHSFVYYESQSGECMRQLCRYCVSSLRDKMHAVLNFRNSVADTPYLFTNDSLKHSEEVL